jgi:hypothetical protein
VKERVERARKRDRERKKEKREGETVTHMQGGCYVEKKETPSNPQSINQFITSLIYYLIKTGRLPKSVHLHVQRHPMALLPETPGQV